MKYILFSVFDLACIITIIIITIDINIITIITIIPRLVLLTNCFAQVPLLMCTGARAYTQPFRRSLMSGKAAHFHRSQEHHLMWRGVPQLAGRRMRHAPRMWRGMQCLAA